MIKTMMGSELIVHILAQNGFDCLFGVPGRRVLPLYDAIYRSTENIKILPTQNEQGAAFMADGYARITQKGCCLGISGPGALNMVTGVAAAYADSVPVLVLGGQAQTASMGKYAIQEATGLGRTPDQLGIFQRITKHAARVETSERIIPVMLEAIEALSSGRPGPVYVELPTNILHDTVNVDPTAVLRVTPAVSRSPLPLHAWPFEALIADLLRARYPILLIGAGVAVSGAHDELRYFAEKLGIPFVTTTLAKGTLPEESELSLGSCGIWGQPAAGQYLLEHCDAILALGTTFQELSSYGWRIKNEQVLLRVDIDASELHRNYSAKHSCHGDAKEFLTELNQFLDARDVQLAFTEARRLVAALKQERGYYTTIPHAEEVARSDFINPIALVKAISQHTTPDTPIVSDVGENGAWSMYLIQRDSVGSYFINAGLGTMGHAVAAAIGMSVAAPGRKIVAICGDGGFMMNGNELASAANFCTNVLWVVFNNGILGTQKHYQRDYLNGRYIASDMPNIDYCTYAAAMGVRAVRVDSLEDFKTVYQQCLVEPGNVVIEARIDPDIKPQPSFFY